MAAIIILRILREFSFLIRESRVTVKEVKGEGKLKLLNPLMGSNSFYCFIFYLQGKHL